MTLFDTCVLLWLSCQHFHLAKYGFLRTVASIKFSFRNIYPLKFFSGNNAIYFCDSKKIAFQMDYFKKKPVFGEFQILNKPDKRSHTCGASQYIASDSESKVSLPKCQFSSLLRPSISLIWSSLPLPHSLSPVLCHFCLRPLPHSPGVPVFNSS